MPQPETSPAQRVESGHGTSGTERVKQVNKGFQMKLSVFGLGYVGCVSAACFADAGHDVIGVDINALKVDIINGGRSPIVEPGVQTLIARAVREKRLKATTD